jgi:glycosyltransferase involved in cell wall biosynthesis
MPRRRLLVISTILPFPRNTGQQQRIYYKLRVLRPHFHITFLTLAPHQTQDLTHHQLQAYCDDAIVLPSRYTKNDFFRIWHRMRGGIFVLQTGLKFSNYLIGEVEFSPDRLTSALVGKTFDLAVFEYWHAFQAVSCLRAQGIPCVLDMHDVLWQSYSRQLATKRYLPTAWKRWALSQYKTHEELAWEHFDAIIAINDAEYENVRQVVDGKTRMYCVPMGVDLDEWSYNWNPISPPRIAFYGGLGSSHNQQNALICYREIMPMIWRQHPQAEFWVVGSNPPKFIRALENDKRVHVTGYVERIQDVLSSMTLVLCPWSGTYGFRSRLVEVMALGVPVVASTEAAYGMRLKTGEGIFLEDGSEKMTLVALELLGNKDLSIRQSHLARKVVEEYFGNSQLYGRLVHILEDAVNQHARHTA